MAKLKGNVFYHATTEENAIKILTQTKFINPSQDGLIYMCKTTLDCYAFMMTAGIKRFVFLPIIIPQNQMKNVQETFDHNFSSIKGFENVRSWGYTGKIPISWIAVDEITVTENPTL